MSLLERDGARARLVGVLEAQDERAADVAGEQVVEERGPGRPDVEGAGGAGRDADAGVGHAAIVRAVRTPEPSAPPAGPRRSASAHARRGRGGRAPGPPRRRSTRTSAAGRSPRVARPSGPSSVDGVQRRGARQDRHVGARRQAPRLEVREERRILLGRLGDPVDRRSRARLEAGQRHAGRPALGRRPRRSGCRAGRSPGGPAARRGAPRREARSRPAGGPPPRPTRPSRGRRPW